MKRWMSPSSWGEGRHEEEYLLTHALNSPIPLIALDATRQHHAQHGLLEIMPQAGPHVASHTKLRTQADHPTEVQWSAGQVV